MEMILGRPLWINFKIFLTRISKTSGIYVWPFGFIPISAGIVFQHYFGNTYFFPLEFVGNFSNPFNSTAERFPKRGPNGGY